VSYSKLAGCLLVRETSEEYGKRKQLGLYFKIITFFQIPDLVLEIRSLGTTKGQSILSRRK
jgi:hypothetical protein